MWTKDTYQEQMLGYLGGVLTEIERLEQFRIRQNELTEVYDDLVIALERLWRLIGASDADWEGFRYPLEDSCDTLLREFYRVSGADSLRFSFDLTGTENHERIYQSQEPMMVW